jgi:SAM-dependent methyltransferase
MEIRFTHAYENNVWAGRDSRSGSGSELDQTQTLIAELPPLFRALGVRSVLDIPCGDFHWMSRVDLSGIDYVGADVVAPIIERNQGRHGAANIAFRRLDLASDRLPKADLILCRDCLVHLSYRHIFRALRNMVASGSTYLLTTTFTDRSVNSDCATGSWRVLNLEKAPFLLPPPIRIVSEKCTENDGIYTDKSLGLWRLSDIGPRSADGMR